jgi:hypothetical protein
MLDVLGVRAAESRHDRSATTWGEHEPAVVRKHDPGGLRRNRSCRPADTDPQNGSSDVSGFLVWGLTIVSGISFIGSFAAGSLPGLLGAFGRAVVVAAASAGVLTVIEWRHSRPSTARRSG